MKAALLSFFLLFSFSVFANEPVNTVQATESQKQFKLSQEMQQALEQDSSRVASDGLSSSERFVKYLKSGFVHIIPMGVDHILFVLGLFLATLSMSKLFWQVTTFTLAHSITLALAATGVVSLSGDIVEPLIALSIAYLAYENIRKTEVDNSRLMVIFVFGLLHGLGFASVLREFGLPTESFVASLLAFNIGVEIGQLTVIATAFCLLFAVRHKTSYRKWVQIPASLAIGAVGLFWTVERVLG